MFWAVHVFQGHFELRGLELRNVGDKEGQATVSRSVVFFGCARSVQLLGCLRQLRILCAQGFFLPRFKIPVKTPQPLNPLEPEVPGGSTTQRRNQGLLGPSTALTRGGPSSPAQRDGRSPAGAHNPDPLRSCKTLRSCNKQMLSPMQCCSGMCGFPSWPTQELLHEGAVYFKDMHCG